MLPCSRRTPGSNPLQTATILIETMASNKWALLYSIWFLLVFNIDRIEAQTCGGTYTPNSGVFMSHNYPNVYSINLQCTYAITPSTISSITLNFETFELDRSSGDYITISCVSNTSYEQTKYYWNTNTPPISIPWCSSGQLYFLSDMYQNYTTRGFKVHYQVSTKDCGKTVFTASSGTISSPNYPYDYSNDANCTYTIWAPSPSLMALKFNVFDLESDCQRDWVQIWCDNSTYILPRYCGSTLPKPANINNCNKVIICLSSGFSLQYTVTPKGCGKSSYSGLSGVITSPSFPDKYNNLSCYYYLYSVSSVALAFQSFNLEPFIDSVSGDHVQIECYSDSSYGLRQHRGNFLPPLTTYALCSHVRIYFYANQALSGTGFSLRYQINPLIAHSAITTAPTNITVDIGNRVQLNCTSDADGYYPSWTMTRDDGSDENVIASFCVVNSGYAGTYSVEKGLPGVCDLVIANATLAEYGTYTCVDVGLASISSIVTVQDPYASGSSADKRNVVIIVLAVLLASVLTSQ